MPVYPKPGSKGRKHRVVIWWKNRCRERIVEGTRAEAIAYEARERTRLEAGEALESRVAPTFSAFCAEKYRVHAEMHLKESTWKVRQYQLANLIEWFGETKLTGFSTDAVEKYKQHRLGQGAKPVTINTELSQLRTVLNYAKQLGAPTCKFTIKHLPVRGIGRVTWWTEQQIAMLLAEVEREAPAILPLVVFVANTGVRKGEAIALEWKSVDLERGEIRIWPSEYWQPKSDEPREIPISDALLPWLSRVGASKRWVFTSRDGARFAYWPKRQFDRARKLAGHADSCGKRNDKKCTCGAEGLRGGPHTLRHSFASHFLKSVPDIFLLAKVLGHSHARTTKLYAHLLPDHLARARNAVSFSAGVGPAAHEASKRWGK